MGQLYSRYKRDDGFRQDMADIWELMDSSEHRSILRKAGMTIRIADGFSLRDVVDIYELNKQKMELFLKSLFEYSHSEMQGELIGVSANTGKTCDFCGAPALYDGKTVYGPWANMCERCFQENGVGLGTGKGQKLKQKPDTLDDVSNKTYHVTDDDFESMVMDGILHVVCPYCGSETGAEPDASYVYCDKCGRKIDIFRID